MHMVTRLLQPWIAFTEKRLNITQPGPRIQLQQRVCEGDFISANRVATCWFECLTLLNVINSTHGLVNAAQSVELDLELHYSVHTHMHVHMQVHVHPRGAHTLVLPLWTLNGYFSFLIMFCDGLMETSKCSAISRDEWKTPTTEGRWRIRWDLPSTSTSWMKWLTCSTSRWKERALGWMCILSACFEMEGHGRWPSLFRPH